MRSIRAVPIFLVALAIAGTRTHAAAQLAGLWDPHTARAGVYVADRYLADVYERLLDASSTFRALADSVQLGRLPVFIGTQEQSQRRIIASTPLDLEDSPALARLIISNRDGEKRYIAGVIVIDVETVRRWHARLADLDASDFEQDVAVMLAHEFIHVASVATSRTRRSACLDPDRVALLAEQLGHKTRSCVLEWENRIRAELGLEERLRYLDPALRIGDRLDVETMLEDMRLAREARPAITRVAAVLPRRDHSYSNSISAR